MIGLAGLRSVACRKWVSGLQWLFTGGLFPIGVIVDLFLIPGMVERANIRTRLNHLEFDAWRTRPAY